MFIVNENVDKSLATFRELLVKANQVQNLVSRKSVDKTIDDLIRESLLPLDWEVCQLASPLLDIGSGGGFPGIPLKLNRPDLVAHLLDSQGKKCAWLDSLRREMALEGVEVLNYRAEDLVIKRRYSAFYGTVVSRATAPTKDLLVWSKHFLKPGGELIAWKGSSLEAEMKQCDWRGWSPPEILRQPSGMTLLRVVKLS